MQFGQAVGIGLLIEKQQAPLIVLAGDFIGLLPECEEQEDQPRQSGRNQERNDRHYGSVHPIDGKLLTRGWFDVAICGLDIQTAGGGHGNVAQVDLFGADHGATGARRYRARFLLRAVRTNSGVVPPLHVLSDAIDPDGVVVRVVLHESGTAKRQRNSQRLRIGALRILWLDPDVFRLVGVGGVERVQLDLSIPGRPNRDIATVRYFFRLNLHLVSAEWKVRRHFDVKAVCFGGRID